MQWATSFSSTSPTPDQRPFTVILLAAVLLSGAAEGAPGRGGIPPKLRNHAVLAHSSQLSPPRMTSWLGRSNFTCKSLHLMLRKKQELTKLISSRMEDFKKTIRKEAALAAGVGPGKSGTSKSPTKGKSSHHSQADFKLKVLKLYQQEVDASEEALLVVLRGLQRTLTSDYQSLEKIQMSCEMRQKEMQSVALQVEEHHNTLHKLNKEAIAIQKNLNSTKDHHRMMDDILSEISEAADKLENNLKEDLFSDMVGVHGAGVETVLKVGVAPSDDEQIKRGQEVHDYGGQVLIIDSHSNQYMLSRPRDITALVEDPHLVKDVVLLLVFGSLLGAICCLLNIPSLFGYGVAGMLLGPANYNMIRVRKLL